MGRDARIRRERRESPEDMRAKIRAFKEAEPQKFEIALGMAMYDFQVTEGKHPAARAFLEIVEQEGLA